MQVTRLVERGTYHRLSDPVVKQWPAMFEICVPITDALLGEIER
jgi:hypothetical protein